MNHDFPSKNFFQKENIEFSCRLLSLFLKLPMTRRVQVCKVFDLSNTLVGCHRGLGGQKGRRDAKGEKCKNIRTS